MQEPLDLPQVGAPQRYDSLSSAGAEQTQRASAEIPLDDDFELGWNQEPGTPEVVAAAAQVAVSDSLEIIEIPPTISVFHEHAPRVYSFIARADQAATEHSTIVPPGDMAWYSWHTGNSDQYVKSLGHLDHYQLVALHNQAVRDNDMEFAADIDASIKLRQSLEDALSTGLLADYLLCLAAAGVSPYANATEAMKLIAHDQRLEERLKKDAWRAARYVARSTGDITQAWYEIYAKALQAGDPHNENARGTTGSLRSLSPKPTVTTDRNDPSYQQQLVLLSERARGGHALTKEQQHSLDHFKQAAYMALYRPRKYRHDKFYNKTALINQIKQGYYDTSDERWRLSQSGIITLINMACAGDKTAVEVLASPLVMTDKDTLEELAFAATRHPQLADTYGTNAIIDDGDYRPSDYYRAAVIHGWDTAKLPKATRLAVTMPLNNIRTLWPIMLTNVALTERLPAEAADLYDQIFMVEQTSIEAQSRLEIELHSAQIKAQGGMLHGLAEKIELISPLAAAIEKVVEAAVICKNPSIILEFMIAAEQARTWIEQIAPGTSQTRPDTDTVMTTVIQNLVLQAADNDRSPFNQLSLRSCLEAIKDYSLPLSLDALHDLFKLTNDNLRLRTPSSGTQGTLDTIALLETLDIGISCWQTTLLSGRLGSAYHTDTKTLYKGMINLLNDVARSTDRADVNSLTSQMRKRLREIQQLQPTIVSKQ